MSFKCQKCNVQQPSGQPMNKVVTESRPKKYTYQYGTEYKEATETSEGWEIKKEMAVCPTCYKEMTGEEAQKVQVEVPVKPRVQHAREEEQQPFRRHGPFRNSERKTRQEQRKAPIVEVVNPVRK